MTKDSSSKASILVTGGTGYLGQQVCKLLAGIKADFVISTHRREALTENGVYLDMETGEGIKDAISGIDVILHLASDKKKPDHDVSGIQRLLREMKQQQAKIHLIYISIVGIDLLPMPYFKQKLMAEQEIVTSGVNWSIIRATQFHNYVDELLHQFLSFPVCLLPKKVPVQPIDMHLVAEKLVKMVDEEPLHKIINMGGEEMYDFITFAESWLKIRNKRRLIFNFPLWGKWGKNLKNGALTTTEIYPSGLSWESWLGAKYVNQ